MADIPQPYRPFDLIQSGLDSAGQGITQHMATQAKKRRLHPAVEQYVRNALSQQGVAPDKMENALDRFELGINSGQPNESVPPMASGAGANATPGGLIPPSNSATPSVMPEMGRGQAPGEPQGASQAPAAPSAAPAPQTAPAPTQTPPAQSGGLIPGNITGEPAGIRQAGAAAAGVGLDVMKQGLPKNQFQQGPNQQRLEQPLMPTSRPTQMSAPAQARAAPIGDASNPDRPMTAEDLDDSKEMVNTAVATKGRSDVASIKAASDEKKRGLQRDLTYFRENNRNTQLAAKLEQGAFLAMTKMDVQQQGDYFDFAADLIRQANQAESIAVRKADGQQDWQVALLKLQGSLQQSLYNYVGRLRQSMNYDPKMEAMAAEVAQKAADIINNTMRGMDKVATDRGDSELFRKEGATSSPVTDSSGKVIKPAQELEQGGSAPAPGSNPASGQLAPMKGATGKAVPAEEPKKPAPKQAPSAPKKAPPKAAAPAAKPAAKSKDDEQADDFEKKFKKGK